MPKTLEEIKLCLQTQDNRMTSHAMFIVQQKRKIQSTDDSDNYEWVEEGDWEPVDARKARSLDRYYERFDKEPEGYTRFFFVEIWEFCTACFTEQGCKDYLAVNGHNLKEPRIYVHSGYRNAEWIFLREFLGAENP
jgi:hypothetical protein